MHAVFSGAGGQKDSGVKLIQIDQRDNLSEEAWPALDQGDCHYVDAPTYMTMASWQCKKVADASSRRWAELVWQNKRAAGFTNSATINADKAMTIAWMSHFTMQHGMIWVSLGVLQCLVGRAP